MAKKTMDTIAQAEQNAQAIVQEAVKEGIRLRKEASEKGAYEIASAEKEARKQADILCGAARADSAKRKLALEEESLREQEAWQNMAEKHRKEAVQGLINLILERGR